jgi:ketosteroid isomerase-like protein
VNTQNLLDTYYEGIATRTGWEEVITDDFAFTGANAGNGSRGKAAYREVMRQFGRTYESVSVKDAVVNGNKGCAIVSYGVVSPSGRKASFDIAELWTVRDGKLASLTIYFDTAGWKTFMAS